MSEQKNRQHHAYDIPTPPLGPSTVSSGIKKDLPCSSPNCPNFCSTRCGFCDFHCGKFHNGIHYKPSKGLRATIPDGVTRYLDLEKGHTLEWKVVYLNGKPVSIVTKSEKEKSDSEIQEITDTYNSITDEDIKLVSQQANVSYDIAQRALVETGNDLAKAILRLTSK